MIGLHFPVKGAALTLLTIGLGCLAGNGLIDGLARFSDTLIRAGWMF